MSDHAELAVVASSRWGLPTPVLVRSGMNSLFHAGDDAVVRVGPSTFGASTEMVWLETLARHGVRTPRLLRDIVEVEGVCIAALERVHPSGVVDWREAGAMVRTVHDIDPSEAPGLPSCVEFPHWQIETVLDDVGGLVDAAAMAGMRRCIDRWAGWREGAVDDVVVCHGDMHPGNVLPTDDGPVLLDWDLRCMAPRGWDHSALLTWTERWDGEPGLYDAFAAGYGRSMRGDVMADAFADLRLLVATLMRLRAGRTNAAAATEAALRLRYWRGEPEAPRWHPQ